MREELTLTFTISDPNGLAADLFLGRLIDSPGELGAILWDSLLDRYRSECIRAGMSSNDRPFKITFELGSREAESPIPGRDSAELEEIL